MAWKGTVGRGFDVAAFRRYCQGLRLLWRPQFVVLHNTSLPTLAQWPNCPGRQRMANLANYYRNTMHWSAGPHLFVAPDLIWVFTPLTVPGVHSPSWNAISWGVEMVGEYEREPFDEGPGAAVRDNTAAAIACLDILGNLDSSTLRLHREDPRTDHTSCPGHLVDKAAMVGRIHDRLVAWGRHL